MRHSALWEGASSLLDWLCWDRKVGRINSKFERGDSRAVAWRKGQGRAGMTIKGGFMIAGANQALPLHCEFLWVSGYP